MNENDVNESGRSTARGNSVIPCMSDKVAAATNSAAIDRLVRTAKYQYIVAWGKWLGFTPGTVQKYVTEAEADNAPYDVIQKIEGTWLRLDDITNDSNRAAVMKLAVKPPDFRLR